MTHYIILFLLGLAFGALLFSIAYWRGIREGRRRARREAQKKEPEASADRLSKAVAPVEETKGVDERP